MHKKEKKKKGCEDTYADVIHNNLSIWITEIVFAFWNKNNCNRDWKKKNFA